MDRVHHQKEGRAILTRIAAPGLALLVVIMGIGLLLTPPGIAIHTSEDAISAALEETRTGTWNTITLVWSSIGSTPIVIGVCLLVAAFVLHRTRDWRLAAVPAVALLMQAIIFATTSSLVDRARPPVTKLDQSPPTTSYPSGHVGASTALYVAVALLALRIERAWLRRTILVLSAIPPLLVAFSRLYRGMHHLTDIGGALLNGVTCALLTYWWYRSSKRQNPSAAAANNQVVRHQSRPEPQA